MNQPTQAQIEAALKTLVGRGVGWGDVEKALTAAAEVGGIQVSPDPLVKPAAEAGGEKAEDRTITNQREVARIKAAAAKELREVVTYRELEMIEKSMEWNKAIERCAQVAEGCTAGGEAIAKGIAAAIRAMKEES